MVGPASKGRAVEIVCERIAAACLLTCWPAPVDATLV